MPSRFGLTYFIALCAFLLTACGGGGSSGSGAPPTPAPSSLSYTSPQVLVVGTAMTALSPTVTGTVTSYSVSPKLPAGLSLATSTGIISGTPSATAAAASYTVTATNSSGMTTAAVSITVNDVAPSVGYGSTSYTFTTGVPLKVAPTSTGGTVTAWSISPALPAGLSFSTADGSISGTPTAVAPAAPYTVTAQNSGGNSTVNLKVAIESGVLLNLGHSVSLNSIYFNGTRILSQDGNSHWVLWDYSAGTLLAQGDNPCLKAGNPCFIPYLPLDLKGSIFVTQTNTALEVHAASDGSLLATITATPSWWKVATDGSYIAAGDASGLTVWSASGQSLFVKAGDYHLAQAFAAPNEIRVATGPAGANVVETISLPSGASTPTPQFAGTFQSWFLDGERFLTTATLNVWVYSRAGVQQEFTTLPTVQGLAGEGQWFWTLSTANSPGLNIYAVGPSTTPAFTLPAAGIVFRSATALAVPTASVGSNVTMSIIDLSGATPTKADYTLPTSYPYAFGATSKSSWVVGSSHGRLLDGASVGGTLRYFGYGQVWALAGTAGGLAVATADGNIRLFDAATLTLQQTLSFPASLLALSDDGTVLAAGAEGKDNQYLPDRTVKTFSLPSGNVINTWPYTFYPGGNLSYPPGAAPYACGLMLSASGTVLGQILAGSASTPRSFTREVTPVAGGSVIWSDTPGGYIDSYPIPPLWLSPDGSLVAAVDGNTQIPVLGPTHMYKNGVLVGATTDPAVGWLDNNHLLANSYVPGAMGSRVFAHASIYDSTGVLLNTTALPEVHVFQALGADSIYSPELNSILSVSTGAATWTSPNPTLGMGAVVGSRVVFVSGATVRMERH